MPGVGFDTLALLRDPRHVRSDARLIIHAARKGWLDRLPPERLNALQERLFMANSDASQRNDWRAVLSTALAFIEMDKRILQIFDAIRPE